MNADEKPREGNGNREDMREIRGAARTRLINALPELSTVVTCRECTNGPGQGKTCASPCAPMLGLVTVIEWETQRIECPTDSIDLETWESVDARRDHKRAEGESVSRSGFPRAAVPLSSYDLEYSICRDLLAGGLSDETIATANECSRDEVKRVKGRALAIIGTLPNRDDRRIMQAIVAGRLSGAEAALKFGKEQSDISRRKGRVLDALSKAMRGPGC